MAFIFKNKIIILIITLLLLGATIFFVINSANSRHIQTFEGMVNSTEQIFNEDGTQMLALNVMMRDTKAAKVFEFNQNTILLNNKGQKVEYYHVKTSDKLTVIYDTRLNPNNIAATDVAINAEPTK